VGRAAPREAAGHDVVFAASDAELANVVALRVGEALGAGSTVIVVSTVEHQRGFADAAAAAGVDVGAARIGGSLIELDAAATLSRLLTGGVFDPAEFDRVMGTLVRRASSRRPVQVFGEMVGLLWAAGRGSEAVALEAAWIRLLGELPARHLCGYAVTAVRDAETGHGHGRACRLHSAIVEAPGVERVPASVLA
jgi:hypothetical protein